MTMPQQLQGRLRLPIISAPMFLGSGVDLVVGACRAGVVGTFPALNLRTTEDFDGWLTQIETALAEPLQERAIALQTAFLGPNHPDTLTSRNNLARAYQDADRLEQAIDLHEQTLADCERVLGPDHPDTLTTRNNIAYLRELER